MGEIPILLHHDHTRIIGKVQMVEGGRARVEFTEEVQITKDQFFEIFGDPGFVPLDVEHDKATGLVRIKKAEILEFSLSPGTLGAATLEAMKTLDLKAVLALERFEAVVRTLDDAELLGQLVGHRFAIDALEAVDAAGQAPDATFARVARLLATLMANEATIQNECERRRLPI